MKITLKEMCEGFEQESWTQAVLTPGKMPLLKVSGQWVPRGPILHNEYQLFDFPEIAAEKTAQQMVDFNNLNPFRGHFMTQKSKVQFLVFPLNDTWSLQLVRQPELSLEELDLSDNFLRSLDNPKGLYLLFGGRDSGKETLATQIINRSVFKTSLGLFVGEGLIEAADRVLRVNSVNFEKGNWPTEAVDFVVIEPGVQVDQSRIFRELSRGVTIFWVIDSLGLSAGLEDLANRLSDDKWSQLVRSFSWAISIQRNTKARADSVFAAELCSGTKGIRQALQTRDWDQFEQSLHATADSAGARSLNQSLVSLILKRKVDLRAGFEMSSKPEELDQMLKQIGI